MVDALLVFREREVFLDRDVLAVLKQRGFYNLSDEESPFFAWCRRMNEGITRGLDKIPLEYQGPVLVLHAGGGQHRGCAQTLSARRLSGPAPKIPARQFLFERRSCWGLAITVPKMPKLRLNYD
jgi:hypothetical protein